MYSIKLIILVTLIDILDAQFPCDNENSGNVCHCLPGYESGSCTLKNNLCGEKLVHGQYPCKENKMVCEGMFSRGYICKSPTKMSEKLCKVNNHTCPSQWSCFDVQNGYRCEPYYPSNIARLYEYVLSQQVKYDHFHQLKQQNACTQPCQFGSKCVNKKCKCLKHFKGPYCNQFVDYCSRNVCQRNVTCIPRLGGHTCLCPSSRTGKNCEFIKDNSFQTIQYPDVLYEPLQYCNFSFYFVFHAKSLGTFPEVEINFGDGTVMKKTRDYVYLNNACETLIKHCRPPLRIVSNQMFAYTFVHMYKHEGIYKITVKAHNSFYEVFNTKFKVRVVVPKICDLQVRLDNAAQTMKQALIYHATHSIVIRSVVQINCSQAEIVYQWNIYKVNSFMDLLNTTNLYSITSNIVRLTENNLNIPPYTLDYGNYVVELFVKMRKPLFDINRKVLTWFTVQRKAIIAHIDGGTVIQAQFNASFYLDASLSYNPNYKKCKQPELFFQWFCTPYDNPFCKDEKPLNETGSILKVPANVLVTGSDYMFMIFTAVTIKVGLKHEELEDKYKGTYKQVVQIRSQDMPLINIKCIKNCLGGYANTYNTIALLGICLSCPLGSKMINSWVVYPNSKNNTNKHMSLDSLEFSSQNNNIIIYDKELDQGLTYKFVFSGYSKDDPILGMAEMLLTTYEDPNGGVCKITPPYGTSMVTLFTVDCEGFLVPKTPYKSGALLTYEVTQFLDLEDRAGSGILVGYDVTGTMTKITLGPGVLKFNYQTTLRIIATSFEGTFAHYEMNVTVFPIINYLRDSLAVLDKFNSIGSGYYSLLGLLSSAGSINVLISQIISAAVTLRDFAESPDAKSIDPHYLHVSVKQLRDMFLLYLYEVSFTNLESIKHMATALDRVLALSSLDTIHEPSAFVSISIVKTIVNKLEKSLEVYEEEVQINVMNDLGVLLTNIASYLLNIPLKSLQKVLDDNYLRILNPNQVEENVPTTCDSLLVICELFRYMRMYQRYKVPNERTTLITGPKVSMLIKNGSPMHLTRTSLELASKASVQFNFDNDVINKRVLYHLEMLIMDDNPNWVDLENTDYHYPFVKINLTNASDNKPMDAIVIYEMRPLHKVNLKTIKGAVPIRSFWKIKDEHIQVYRIRVQKGVKLLLKFDKLPEKSKVRVVIKNDEIPRMMDFWNNGITIPQTVNENSFDEGLSIYINDENVNDGEYIFLGILPHPEMLRELMKDVEEPLLPYLFDYDNTEFNETIKKVIDKHREDVEVQTSAPPRYIKQLGIVRNSENINLTMPFSFTAHTAQCVVWNEKLKTWSPKCSIKPSSTASQIICNCSGFYTVSVDLRSAEVHLHQIRPPVINITFYDNPLLLCIFALSLILFVGLFVWAKSMDRQDRLRTGITFLIDNNPTFDYYYFVIVYTGYRAQSGTTSNVAVVLEGTRATSLPHILTDCNRKVLNRGNQDWFVIKTQKNLGHIYCLHLWTDYSGPSPGWYCDKVIVQDLQQRQLWFYTVEKWFSPLYGDGSMSYTVYQTTDSKMFSRSYQFQECLICEFDSGMHGWFSIFQKHPCSNYSRKQRLGVAYTHLAMIMLTQVFLYERPMYDSPTRQIYANGLYKWEMSDVLKGFYAVLIAFPFHLCLVWLFRCISPRESWTKIKLDTPFERYNISSSVTSFNTTSNTSSNYPGENISVNDLEVSRKTKYLSKTSVVFNRDDYGYHWAGRGSLQDRFRFAGNERVVPLRKPISSIETNTAGSSGADTPDSALNDPIYGEQITQQSYCFPAWFSYIGWILILVIALPCLYFTVLDGVSYGWVLSLHYLVSLFAALLISMFMLETLKWFFFSYISFSLNKREIALENRYDLVNRFNPDTKIPPSINEVIMTKINKLRESSMYSPMEAIKTNNLIKTKTIQTALRMMFVEFMIIILFLLLLTCMIYNVLSPLAYLHYKNIDIQVSGRSSFKNMMLTEVHEVSHLIEYLKTTLIPNLHKQQISNSTILEPITDEMNYLIGVVRLRQLRMDPSECSLSKNKKRYFRCEDAYDNKNYSQGWKEPDDARSNRGSFTFNPWKHQTEVDVHFSVMDNNAKYKHVLGAYVANLGPTREKSEAILDYLVRYNWFNRFTEVVFVDVVLFNPHITYLSIITILVERTGLGRFHAYKDIGIVKLRTLEAHVEVLFILLFIVVFIAVIIHMNHESKQITVLLPHRVFALRWTVFKFLLVVLAISTVIVYKLKSVYMEYYTEQIINSLTEQYNSFGYIFLWNWLLIPLLVAIIIFLTANLWHLLNIFYTVKIITFTFKTARRYINDFLILFLVLLAAFAWLGVVFFGRSTVYFRNFWSTITTLIAFIYTNSKAYQLGSSLSGLMMLYYAFAFVVIYIVFRCLLATILLHAYSSIKRKATDKASPYYDDTPNSKLLKAAILIDNVEARLRVIGFLFLDFINRFSGNNESEKLFETRQIAADAIAFEIIQKQFLNTVTRSATQERIGGRHLDDEQAKALARTIILMNLLTSKLDYLDAKIHSYIFHEQYKLSRSPKTR